MGNNIKKYLSTIYLNTSKFRKKKKQKIYEKKMKTKDVNGVWIPIMILIS